MRLDELGEFELIARLTQGLETRADVVLGVGDDAALLDIGAAPGMVGSEAGSEAGGGPLLVATCDAQVQGRHFLLGAATPEEIGWKALAVNLSDIAAMGAEPLWALVSLLAPPALPVATLDGIYSGMRQLAQRYGVAVVGGNVAATDGPLVLDVTLLGRCARDAALRRDGARPGDALLVTGPLGAAAAGLALLLTPPPEGAVAAHLLVRARAAQVMPEPRVAVGRALAASGSIMAMLDISDGLAGDLAHICERSGVGALIEAQAIPVDPAARAVARALGRDPLALALTGGEDYELLCAVRPERLAIALAAVRQAGGEPALIGRVTERGAGMLLRLVEGDDHPLTAQGWDHLRPSAQ